MKNKKISKNYNDKFILVNGKVVVEPNLIKWSKWFENSHWQRIVCKNEVGGKHLSTVFLALDHGFGSKKKPVLWETMLFTKKGQGQLQSRYTSREDAVRGHNKILRRLFGKIK